MYYLYRQQTKTIISCAIEYAKSRFSHVMAIIYPAQQTKKVKQIHVLYTTRTLKAMSREQTSRTLVETLKTGLGYKRKVNE